MITTTQTATGSGFTHRHIHLVVFQTARLPFVEMGRIASANIEAVPARITEELQNGFEASTESRCSELHVGVNESSLDQCTPSGFVPSLGINQQRPSLRLHLIEHELAVDFAPSRTRLLDLKTGSVAVDKIDQRQSPVFLFRHGLVRFTGSGKHFFHDNPGLNPSLRTYAACDRTLMLDQFLCWTTCVIIQSLRLLIHGLSIPEGASPVHTLSWHNRTYTVVCVTCLAALLGLDTSSPPPPPPWRPQWRPPLAPPGVAMATAP